MTYIKISIGIFLALAASRFIPHPPNFTSLIALSFYVPAIIGLRFIPIVLLSFIVTDLFLGTHSTIIYTWTSVTIIGFISNFFKFSLTQRLSGVFLSAWIFYLLTNFGVWAGGMYGYGFNDLILTYNMAIPFFYNTLISTVIYSILIELVMKIFIGNNILSFYKNIFYKTSKTKKYNSN